jgi:hypothetical protein
MPHYSLFRVSTAVIAFFALLIVAVPTARAHAPSGAIFTTLGDGSEVNYNIYPSKAAVYLDGGPGPGSPQTAAGLDNGTYVFQVTDPSGTTLLSTDPGNCRQFTVANGVINAIVPTVPIACQHVTGLDADHNAVTVQLIPYNDTPNPGGEYKVWVTRVEDYACALDIVDCGRTGNNFHGFIPRHCKTDNFKVGGAPREIDTRFVSPTGGYIDGLGITWRDPLGGTNAKWSYLNTALDINHEAHVEAVELGTHEIEVGNQPGCTVDVIRVTGVAQSKNGPQAIRVRISSSSPTTTFIDVYCK